MWNTVSLYYWFITLNLWHFIGRNLKTLNKCVKIFYCSYIQARIMCKRMNCMTCMPFWLVFKYDLHVCMSHLCNYDLHVTVTYMSLWPTCLCDLYVIMSYISVWPISHYGLHVCDLYVIMTYMSLWATFLCDLYVFPCLAHMLGVTTPRLSVVAPFSRSRESPPWRGTSSWFSRGRATPRTPALSPSSNRVVKVRGRLAPSRAGQGPTNPRIPAPPGSRFLDPRNLL